MHTLKTADKPIFLMFFGTKGIFSPKRDFLFVGTPCASNWEVNSWSSASLVWHKEIPKCSSVDLQSPKNPSFFDVFPPKTQFFFTLNVPVFCFNTLCFQLVGNRVSLSALGLTRWNSAVIQFGPANPKKSSSFFDVFRPKTQFSSL